MKLFNCKVRVMGEVKDEVLRTNVTNAEIKVLRSIHGEDGVVDITPTNEDAMTSYVDFEDTEDAAHKRRLRSEAEERERLEVFYGIPAVARLFGVVAQRIVDEPSAIESVMGAVVPLEPPVRAEVKPLRAAPKPLNLEDVG